MGRKEGRSVRWSMGSIGSRFGNSDIISEVCKNIVSLLQEVEGVKFISSTFLVTLDGLTQMLQYGSVTAGDEKDPQ